MKGTIKIEFKGDNCLNCPFSYRTAAFDAYACTAKYPNEPCRVIQEYVEYPSELGPRPDWCPIEIEEN